MKGRQVGYTLPLSDKSNEYPSPGACDWWSSKDTRGVSDDAMVLSTMWKKQLE